MKSRIIITIENGKVSSIQLLPRLIDQVEIITKEALDSDEEPIIALDENGICCQWRKWEANRFDELTDDVYQFADDVFPQS